MSSAFDKLKRRVLARQRADEIIKRQRSGDSDRQDGPNEYEKAIRSKPAYPEPSDEFLRAVGLPPEKTPAEQERQAQAAEAVKQGDDLGF